ncbi:MULTISPECIES: hypothetical protein [Pseudomonas]|jgi:hypothetical protein|uniref:hypothetical protein n=1 Tax=Pseudomonas TaxID=286 RepID=UPI0002D631FD|nr:MULTISPECIES: hypothetical protein [Pseudomonas]NQD56391.1 hypothetical protein [Pseudomonas sp. CM25]
MPTENRSSTIEQHDHIEGIIDMVSAPFQHEDRYIVIKRSDLALLSPVDSDLAHSFLEGVMSLMAEWNCPARECLVIESDWPEFAPAWASIEARVTARPAPQPHPEPIAWMVGTAIWWTKEEAERDAAETGLPLVGLGPMSESNKPTIPEGYCLMPRRLTAENGAKALLLGEFKLEVTRECPECLELDEPADGCEICDGEGEYAQRHTIPWDMIKFIYSEAVKGLAFQRNVTCKPS